MSQSVIDQRIIIQASEWMAKLWAEPSDIEAQQACETWRAEHPDHELAWQRLHTLAGKFNSLPAHAAQSNLLDISAQQKRQTLKFLSVIAAAGGFAYGVSGSYLWQQTVSDYATRIGETRNLTLADGTHIWLNTETVVNVEFSARERRIILKAGELLIVTAQDTAQRPFIVQTQEGNVRPIGTRFSVRHLKGRSQVAVYEGAVELQTNQQLQRLDAGQGTLFTREQILKSTPVDAKHLGWTQGFLVAERMRLSDFAREISRYRHGTVVCDPDVANLQITGVFSLTDTDRALANLAQSLSVELLYRTRFWVMIRANKN